MFTKSAKFDNDKSLSETWWVTNEIAQWVNVLATKPNGLNSIPKTHIVKRENRFPQIVLWPPHMLQHMWPYPHHANVNIQNTNKSKKYRKYPKLLKGAIPCNSELKQIERELSEQVQCLLNAHNSTTDHSNS